MSFMILTCEHCGQTYTFGVVGMDMVGSGHRCPVNSKYNVGFPQEGGEKDEPSTTMDRPSNG